MAIDTTQPLSPGWWMARLSRKMLVRQRRLEMLDLYLKGRPPLDAGVEHASEIYRTFQRKARSNFAELVVEAVRERMTIRGFRTAVDSEDTGDPDAWTIWKANGLDIQFADVLDNMLGLGDGYMIVGMDPATNQPMITAEDPRECITEHDPTHPQRVIAALKLFHDDVNDFDMAYLYLPGIVYTAGRSRRATLRPDGSISAVSFSATGWNWVDSALEMIDLSVLAGPNDFANVVGQSLPDAAANEVPVVPFANKNHLSEFEGHIDLLDRINHTILQRMIITTFQAFKQRAVLGELPAVDAAGNEIDWDTVLQSDPGALWTLPLGTTMWESTQVDLTGILKSISDDIDHLAAVTRTPVHYLSPGDGAESAEGASLAREGLTFKTRDRVSRSTVGATRVMYLAFLFSGDTERADLNTLQPIWAPIERYSLSEMAAASAQAITALPWETIMEQIWQLTPEELQRAKSQRTTDMVVAQQALILAAQHEPPATVPVAPPDGS